VKRLGVCVARSLGNRGYRPRVVVSKERGADQLKERTSVPRFLTCAGSVEQRRSGSESSAREELGAEGGGESAWGWGGETAGGEGRQVEAEEEGEVVVQ
jgi:hypothetical protein